MKKLLIAVCLPFLLAMAVIFLFKEYLLAIDFEKSSSEVAPADYSNRRYIHHFSDHPAAINELLAQHNDSATIYLLGSSELTSNGPFISYNFISDHFPVKVMGIGHEGNQCFSIYSQLLSRSHFLNNAPVVIILSPGWFEAKPARGTTSAVYLEYMSDAAVREMQETKLPEDFLTYANLGLADFYPELNAPSAAYRLAHLKARSQKSFYHRLWCAPLRSWNALTDMFRATLKKNNHRREYQPDTVVCRINIDSLLQVSKEQTLLNATNNNMGIENDYFQQYVGNKRGNIYPVSDRHNRELEDCRRLIQLLKAAHARASFVISPLNPYYFRNLHDLDPVVSSIEEEIHKAGFNTLNLFTSDTAKYDKALLGDIMHMSPYGWMQVNKFIINEYHLCK